MDKVRYVAAFLCSLAWHPLVSQGVDVTARVEVTHMQAHAGTPRVTSAGVVLWLTPLQRPAVAAEIHGAQQYSLVQKDKQFSPHILVVPTGSSVDFPNLDPFYHNVFSLFNGKRFDLGLYDSQTRRSVRFDRDGVSYIFCNIHPEMGAVIISLSTPYYGMSAGNGTINVRGVPPGSYRLNIWAENVTADRLNSLARVVQIGTETSELGIFRLETTGEIMSHHPNKFGESYGPAPKDPY